MAALPTSKEIMQRCFLLLVFFFWISTASKLNVPRVLLPYNHESPSNFTLKVYEGGCYKWTCSSEAVVLEGIPYDGCTNEVIVSAVTRSPSRQTAIVLAQDLASGGILRCDVLIDTMHRLEIVTTTRELYVEEAPEEFEVRAYDDQGNEFSTLEGVEMVWNLQTVTDLESVVPAQTVLRFMTFEESPYKIPPAIAPLEVTGRMGYMVLIEGRQTGSARLSVRVAHPAYKELPPASVNLMVVANLLLDPADVYVLPHTAILYTVYQLKQGHLHTIEVPSSQYYLNVADTEIAQLNSDGISITALSLGTTQVILKDNNVKSSELVKHPTATVHVVDPSYLTITIAPHNNPALIRGKHYAFIVNVYDKHNNRIFLADNIVIETTIPSEYFTSEFVSKNGSYVYGVPIITGKTKVQAVLSAIDVGTSILEISPPLKATQELEIFDPLKVIPPLTILPWDPITKPLYSLNLTAIGGSGSVTWSSSNSEVVGVSQTGLCKTKTLGSVAITAAMVLNPHNRDSAMIHIIEALGLALLEGVVEMEVEIPLPLHVASYTHLEGKQVPFTVCRQLPFKVVPAEETFTALPDVKPPSVKSSCAVVEVRGKSPGFSEVIVSYKSTTGELTASTTVAAFRPLQPINPSSGETVLALESSRIVVFQGGPLPWINKPSTHFAEVSIDSGDEVEVRLVEGSKKQSDFHAVEVLCHGLGEFTLTLTVGNKPSPTLPQPRTVSAGLKVVCALPDAISLSALVRRPKGTQSPCPAIAEIGGSVAHCYKPLNMEVIVTDSENRKFDNISSLSLKWDVSNTLATIPSEVSSLSQTTTLHGYSLPMISHQVLEPIGEVGEVVVSVNIAGYRPGVPDTALDHPPPPLSASLLLRLVQDAALEPLSAVLYQHKDNLLDLNLVGGSGFFELQTAKSDVAAVTYKDKERIVTVQPLSDGELKVELVDVCLDTIKPASSAIVVASIATLELQMVDRVELGGTLEAEVFVRDGSGLLLPAHSLMNLTPHPQANIITTKYQGVNSKGNAIYEVKGRHVGDTTLHVSAGTAGHGEGLIYSPAKPLQVFPKLRLMPRNITLIIGAVYQVKTTGGPYPDAIIEYVMENDSIATTSHAGIVTAQSLGTTTLTAKAISSSKELGQLVVYSQDMVIINVVPLEQIRIYAPLSHLETGTSMPLYAMGSDDQNPLAYATAVPPLVFEWSINNKQSASFSGIFDKNGLIMAKENNGIIRLNAAKPGRVTVTLKVKPSLPASLTNFQIIDNLLLTDKLEVEVFETLKLKHPADGSSNLLISPEADAKIVTNRDGDGKFSYEVEGCRDEEGRSAEVITVDPEGVVKASSTTGQATVVVTIEESFGAKQSLSVLVEVKKVHYMQAQVQQFMSVAPGELVSIVPQGVTTNLHLSYHDDRGRIFHATNAQPAFRPSRFDLIGLAHGASNDSVQLEVRGSGATVLHIWDENDIFISDFILINSGSAITPYKLTVPLGGHICLSSFVQGVDGSKGTWSASEDMLSLNAVTGEGVALQIGRAVVAYEVNSGLIVTTEAVVSPITKITVTGPSKTISNSVGTEEFAKVTLEGEGSTVSSAACTPLDVPASNPPFTCVVAFFPPLPEVDTKEVFAASAVYIPGKGYACRIQSLIGPSSQIATAESALIIEAVVVGRGEQGEVRSGQVAVPFQPAPVTEVGSVKLTNEEPSAVILIQGIPEVLNSLVVSGDAVNVDLGPVEGNQRPLTITVKDSVWVSELTSSYVVSITSPLIGTTNKVILELEQVGDGTCAVPTEELGIVRVVMAVITNYDRFLVSTACLILIVACMLIGYHALYGPGYKETQHKGAFASSSAPSPALSPARTATTTNIRTSSPVGGGSSPTPPRITLWSINDEPIYGAPQIPRRAYEGSPTYGSPK